MTEGRIAQPFAARLKVFHVLFVSRMDRLARDVGRQNDRTGRFVFGVFVGLVGRRRSVGRLLFLRSLDVTLQKGCRLLINVQRETVVRLFAVVAVNARRDSVRDDVLANPLQLVLRAVFQVEERLQANFLTLLFSESESVKGKKINTICTINILFSHHFQSIHNSSD